MAHAHLAALPWPPSSGGYPVAGYNTAAAATAAAAAASSASAPAARRGRPPKTSTATSTAARTKRKAAHLHASSATAASSFPPTPMPVGDVLSALAGAVAMTASMLAAPPPVEPAAPSPEAESSARTKPGRKPLNDVPATRRTAQNRASQRAFRERRQAHLAELEAKVKRYEAERGAVASQLSVLAQRVRDETPRVHALEAALLARDKDIAQWHARCTDLSRALDAVQAAVRTSSEHLASASAPTAALALAPASAPAPIQPSHRLSTASRPSLSTHASASASSSGTEDRSTPPSSLSSARTAGKDKDPVVPRTVTAITMPTGGAGVWTTLPPLDSTSPREEDKWCGGCVTGGECACRGDGIIDFDAGAGTGASANVGAPAAQTTAPALALALPHRRRSKKTTKLWSVYPSGEEPSSECSGDPRTCGACNADPALAAFCEAVNEEEAGRALASQGQVPRRSAPPTRPPSPSRMDEGEGEASVPEAWRQLRSHPHFASFTHDDRAGLHLLADVVAGRDALRAPSRPAPPDPVSRKRRRLHVDRDGIRNALALLDREAWAAGREATPPSPPAAGSKPPPL